MDIQVVIRGYDQGTVHHLLETVREMGEPLSLVQMRPMGLLIPVNLAIKAGLLELPQSSKESKSEPTTEPVKATRRGRPRKQAAPEPEQTEALWEE